MAIPIDHIERIIAKLKAEGKVKVLNSPEDLEEIRKINSDMDALRREFKIKEWESWQSAAKITLD